MSKYSNDDVINALSDLVAEFHVLHGKPHAYVQIGKIQYNGTLTKDMQEKFDLAVDILMSKKKLQNAKDFDKKRINKTRIVKTEKKSKVKSTTEKPATKKKTRKKKKSKASNTETKADFIKAVKTELGDVDSITRKQYVEIREKYNLPRQYWLQDPENIVSRGVYKV